MIDTKRLELPGYNGIPHLLVPVVTDAAQAASALSWLTLQMDDRYRAFTQQGVHSIGEYNSKLGKAHARLPCPM